MFAVSARGPRQTFGHPLSSLTISRNREPEAEYSLCSSIESKRFVSAAIHVKEIEQKICRMPTGCKPNGPSTIQQRSAAGIEHRRASLKFLSLLDFFNKSLSSFVFTPRAPTKYFTTGKNKIFPWLWIFFLWAISTGSLVFNLRSLFNFPFLAKSNNSWRIIFGHQSATVRQSSDTPM